MTTHSSILAWRIPWTEEPGRLQSLGPRLKHPNTPARGPGQDKNTRVAVGWVCYLPHAPWGRRICIAGGRGGGLQPLSKCGCFRPPPSDSASHPPDPVLHVVLSAS